MGSQHLCLTMLLLTESTHRSAHPSRQPPDSLLDILTNTHYQQDPLENHYFSALSWMNKNNFKYSNLVVSKPESS